MISNFDKYDRYKLSVEKADLESVVLLSAPVVYTVYGHENASLILHVTLFDFVYGFLWNMCEHLSYIQKVCTNCSIVV